VEFTAATEIEYLLRINQRKGMALRADGIVAAEAATP
jgi:hypothetical protein